MAHYLVRARPRPDRLEDLQAWLQSGEIAQMEPFGTTLQHSLENARLDTEGFALWEEEDYCRPPLAQERAAVLDDYFTHLTVEPVEPETGWREISHLPRLWVKGRP